VRQKTWETQSWARATAAVLARIYGLTLGAAVEILKSQLATQFAIDNDYSADF